MTGFSSILSQLALFGLNPFEWSVFAVRGNSLELTHLDDPAFKINLKLESLGSGLMRVCQLSLVSL